jgi:hypothetical protein
MRSTLTRMSLMVSPDCSSIHRGKRQRRCAQYKFAYLHRTAPDFSSKSLRAAFLFLDCADGPRSTHRQPLPRGWQPYRQSLLRNRTPLSGFRSVQSHIATLALGVLPAC